MLEKYYRINKALGVSIHIHPDGSIDINACEVSVENNQLSFEKKVISLDDLSKLKNQFSNILPLALNLTGKGILHKQTELLGSVNINNFGKILPNGNIDDFYVQHFTSGNSSFVSAIRSTEADKWIDQLQSFGFQPLQLSLGTFPVYHITSQLNIYDSELIFAGHRIVRNEDGHWTAYHYDANSKSPFPIKVESEIIDEKLIIPYAAAFQLILATRLIPTQADVISLKNQITEVISGRKLKVNGIILLVAFFVLLLINFICFSYLNSENTVLAGLVSRSTQSNVDIQSINEQIKQQEGLLEEMGWEENINKSVLVDQLASLLPEEVSLSDIAVDPVDQAESRTQKTLVFFNRQISVTGTSEKIIPVNEWIARLKTRPWVKNIQMDNYTYNSELSTGQFTVIINY